jgi:hypothetical protein
LEVSALPSNVVQYLQVESLRRQIQRYQTKLVGYTRKMHKYHAILETIDIDIQLGNLLVPHPVPQSSQDRRPNKQEEESVSHT